MTYTRTRSATVFPCSRLTGVFEVPGDKSVSHRIGMLASISSGISRVHGFLNSEDCLDLLKAMESLGARTHFSRDGVVFIHGTGGRFMQPASALDMGNSGTAMRLLSGLLAGQPMTVTLTGDTSLRSRPMTRIKEPLESMGAKVELLGDRNCAPIRITGGHLNPIQYEMKIASAQVKSCVLLAALYAEGVTTITEPEYTRDHTEQIFSALNLPIRVVDRTISLEGFGEKGPSLKARTWHIPGDISSAAFWIVAAAAHRRGSVTLKNVGLNPRRIAILYVLQRMGARIKVIPDKKKEQSELTGEIRIAGGRLKGTVIGGREIPNLIDELPILAVAGALADGETVIKDAAELRVKESDRIKTMCDNLQSMGVRVEEREDGMVIQGPSVLKPTRVVDSYGDHRIAMAMAVLGLFSETPVSIRNIECIETSYPGFWEDLKRLGAHVE